MNPVDRSSAPDANPPPAGFGARIVAIVNRGATLLSAVVAAAGLTALSYSAVRPRATPERPASEHRLRIGVLAHFSAPGGWDNVDQAGAFAHTATQRLGDCVDLVALDLGTPSLHAPVEEIVGQATRADFDLLLAPPRSGELRELLDPAQGANSPACRLLHSTPLLAISTTGSTLLGRAGEGSDPVARAAHSACGPDVANIRYVADGNDKEAAVIAHWATNYPRAAVCACTDAGDSAYADDLTQQLRNRLGLGVATAGVALSCYGRAAGDCEVRDRVVDPSTEHPNGTCSRIMIVSGGTAVASRLARQTFHGFDCVVVSDGLVQAPDDIRPRVDSGARVLGALPCVGESGHCKRALRPEWGPWGNALAQWLEPRLRGHTCDELSGGTSRETLRRWLFEPANAPRWIGYAIVPLDTPSAPSGVAR